MTDNALMTLDDETTAVAVAPDKDWSPQEFAEQFDRYIAAQKVIDERMPDAIMKIKDKQFRKKAYWRAVAKWARLNVEKVEESFFEHAGDWGYRVLYRATQPDGQSAVGDGTCVASEKARKDGSMVDATHHNVRGHAHTRAFNRAVSNLVGFGEVSAEEIIQEWQGNKTKKTAAPTSRPPKDAPQGAKSAPGDSRAWDGNLRFKSGKNEGKRWADMDQKFLDWALAAQPPMNEMAAKEMGRRALEESFEGNDEPSELEPPPEFE